MRTSVERLRIGLLVGAALLVLVIAGFLGYARYRLHHTLAALPGRLGATITKEFNGYTYSQSDGKKTIFTIHAAQAVQHTDGKYTLHDVSMVLYGHKGDRADRISGDDFEYDTKAEVIRAVGIVHIDLQAPAAAGANSISESSRHLGPADVSHREEASGSRVLHVKTSGLVYTRKLGLAATDQGIEFAFGGFTGHAVGAELNSETGHVTLQSAITVSGLLSGPAGDAANGRDGGRAVSLAASHGELDRSTSVAHFANARYSSAEETAQAEAADLHLRPDGSVERIEGERHVLLEKSGQGKVTADRATVTLNTASKPGLAVLTGTVRFSDDEPSREARGESDRATLDFDNQGHLQHSVLEGHVRTQERSVSAAQPSAAWPQRSLEADRLEMFLGEQSGKAQLRRAVATGSARLVNMVGRSDQPGQQPGTTTTKLNADTLQADFRSVAERSEISTMHGIGHTVIDQLTPAGLHQTSSGDTLDAVFHDVAGHKGAVEVATAVQQGGVMIDRSIAALAGRSADRQRATAHIAAFDAGSNSLTLTGSVQMTDTDSALWADRVVLEQDSGDAVADGSVKMTYAQSNSAEPVHILATRAELNHQAGRATFHGGAGVRSSPARLWQSGSSGQPGSQIEAPVLIFEQQEKRLTARAEKPQTAGEVHAVLTSGNPANAEVRTGSVLKQNSPASPVRIISSQMVYSDLRRQAEFTGGVKVFNGDGEMQAQQATVFLMPPEDPMKKDTNHTSNSPGSSAGNSVAVGFAAGSVQRIVASERVEITQPGRRATGDRLVYTASDQMFVLTGTQDTPPTVIDALQGTTTGAMLRFHSGGDSIAILGSDGSSRARRVHTETRVKR